MDHEQPVEKAPRTSRMRRVTRIVKRVLLAGLLATLVFLIFGFFYERAALKRIATELPPPGQLVDVGGRRLHLHIQGDRQPTVVFESGLGASSVAWVRVAPRVAPFARVVTYDRAGLGWSDPGPPCDPGSIASDLHEALSAAGVEGPYVLVGHSIGGVYARMFSYRYPDDVAGIVLVDSSHEDQFDRFPPEFTQSLRWMDVYMPVVALSARFGIPRMVSRFRSNPFLNGSALPDETKRIARELSASHSSLRATRHEVSRLWENGELLRAEEIPWGDLPLTVLSAGNQTMMLPRQDHADPVRGLWGEFQREMASRSTRGRHLVVARCGHGIHLERPDVVVAEILRIVEIVRRNEAPGRREGEAPAEPSAP